MFLFLGIVSISSATPQFEPVYVFEPAPVYPHSALIQGSDGNLYGTTSGGGSFGVGTVFKMGPDGVLTTLVNFDGSNGSMPYASLIQGSDGNFYGTTSQGGSSGYGTVFKMSPDGVLTTLANFTGNNGGYSKAALIQGSDGNFYGTTSEELYYDSYGTVFKVSPKGVLTTLVHFNGSNGSNPNAALIQGSDGNFYGTTSKGGSSDYGTVFKMSSKGVLTTLVHFKGSNGSHPQASLIQGSDGNFYGTTSQRGSSDYGTVFKMSTAGVLTTLVNFNGSNGSYPYDSLMKGSDGYFYGTTTSGGSGDASGKGTIFKMSTTGVLTTLVNFNGSNGSYPYDSLMKGSDGNFYGTTAGGGSSDYGTVFKMSTAGALTTLVHFNYSHGRNPKASLTQGSDGNLYGTSYKGGSNNSGTVFKMNPAGVLTTLVDFNGSNGDGPNALLQGSDGYFYGTTQGGGNSDYGTVFKMSPSGVLTTLVHFNYSNGSYPEAALIQGHDGYFYGTTPRGGSDDHGTVFKMSPSGVLTTLFHFNYDNGSNPKASLIQGSDGYFYGTTSDGGINGPSGHGTVFKISPAGALTTLVNFTRSNGNYPYTSLIQGHDGYFYGTTSEGGSSTSEDNLGYGTVFKMSPDGVLTTLVNFDGSNGDGPNALIQGSDGNFYGTAYEGGRAPDGTYQGGGLIFRIPDPELTGPVDPTQSTDAWTFVQLDANNDGWLTLEEWKNIYIKAPAKEKPFAGLDTSGNGKLTFAEFLVGKTKKNKTIVQYLTRGVAFLELDTDEDDTISASELDLMFLPGKTASTRSKFGTYTFSQWEKAATLPSFTTWTKAKTLRATRAAFVVTLDSNTDKLITIDEFARMYKAGTAASKIQAGWMTLTETAKGGTPPTSLTYSGFIEGVPPALKLYW